VVVISSGNSEDKVVFRWTYVVLPSALLLISVILTAVFYQMLPDEVAYSFSGGEPSHLYGRGGVIAWVIALQAVFTLISLAIAGIAASAGRRLQIGETDLNRSLFTIMGNLTALPQLIVLFAMLDIFLYNAYQIKLIPLWVFAVIVLALGGIVLGVYFIRSVRLVRRLQGKSNRE
jgi:uncharacterized membrane protein